MNLSADRGREGNDPSNSRPKLPMKIVNEYVGIDDQNTSKMGPSGAWTEAG